MYLRTFTLLAAIVCVAYAHTIYDGVEGLNGVEMLTTPRKQVLSFEEEIKGVVDKQESLAEQINDKLTNFEGKVVDAHNPHDCMDLIEVGARRDGVYTIYAENGTPIKVYCDMTNGGWIVIQNRTDKTLDYNKDIADYVVGIGDPSGQHWLGLSTVELLTSSSHWIVHFHLEDFNTREILWEEYRGFRIVGTNYTLMFDPASYVGTAGEALSKHNGLPFTARDHDMDKDDARNCADSYGGGGWWYLDCAATALTTGTIPGGSNNIIWTGRGGILDSAIIKIKRDPCV